MPFLIAFLIGMLSVASYAPLELWWLMPICLAALYHLVVNASPKKAFLLGFIFAFGQFGVGVSWVYVSLQTYGNMPIWMASLAVIGFVGLCAVVTAIAICSYSFLRFPKIGMLNAVLFSSLWVMSEWIRSVLFTGFPWLDVGYSQTTQLLSAFAPLGSVYLVSFVSVLISVNIWLSVFHYLKNSQFKKRISDKGFIASAMLIFLFIMFGLVLQNVTWSQATGDKISVAIVQANVSIEEKWQRELQSKILADYFQLINQYQADLVVLAETALPVNLHQTDSEFWKQLKGQNNAILSGIVERDLIRNKIYNSANLVCGQTPSSNSKEKNDFYHGEQIYRKQHLVPFGEYLPMRSLLTWVLDYLQIPMSDFSAGDRGQTLECQGLNIVLSICYEDAFAAELRRSMRRNSNNSVLINISEDAWFGDSLAPHQRVQMAQMRAIEFSRPMLRSANSGPSSYINFQGDIVATTSQFVKDTILVEVQGRTGQTLFAKYGLWIIYFCFALLVIRIGTIFLAKKHNKTSSEVNQS